MLDAQLTMADTSIIGNLIIYIVVLILAISAHEAAHAWMSYKFGDDTAYLLGRVTLNPVAHTDPLGTLLLPITSFVFSAIGGPLASIPLIGWGKPTPVNPLRWRNKDLANVMVSIAGILANILIAVVSFVILKTLLVTGALSTGFLSGQLAEPVFLLLRMAIMLNASLAIFNLLPIPPLDGSKVLYSILPTHMHPALEALEKYSFIILIAVVYLGVVRVIFAPIARLIDYLLLGA